MQEVSTQETTIPLTPNVTSTTLEEVSTGGTASISTVQFPTTTISGGGSTTELSSTATFGTTPSIILTSSAKPEVSTEETSTPSTPNVTTTTVEEVTSAEITTSVPATTAGGICIYTDWSLWTGCSKSCDVGQRSRTRNLEMENWEMCYVCNETTDEREDCNAYPCEEWNPWGHWSDCSSTGNCTAGIRSRYRSCSGGSCEGDAVDMERCGQWCTEEEASCPPGKIWVSCEDLERSLGEINCQEFFFDGLLLQGEDCEGGACVCGQYNHTSEGGECESAEFCPCYTEDGVEVAHGASITEGCQICTCNLKLEWAVGINVPVLECTTNTSCCDWSEWTPWGSCNVSCGEGSMHRYRDLLSGEDCGPEIDIAGCIEQCSSDCEVNGTGFHCGDVIYENSTHTCYCTTGNGTDCVEKIPEVEGECKKYTKTEILYDPASNCTSKGNVTVDFCSGSCGNSTFEGLLVFDKTDFSRQMVNCECCTGTFSETMQEVTLICGPNGEERTAYMPKIDKCTCSPCSGATSVTLAVTEQYALPI